MECWGEDLTLPISCKRRLSRPVSNLLKKMAVGPAYACVSRFNKESADNSDRCRRGGRRNLGPPNFRLKLLYVFADPSRTCVYARQPCAATFVVQTNLRGSPCSGFLIVRQCYSQLQPGWRSSGKAGMQAARKSRVKRL